MPATPGPSLPQETRYTRAGNRADQTIHDLREERAALIDYVEELREINRQEKEAADFFRHKYELALLTLKAEQDAHDRSVLLWTKDKATCRARKDECERLKASLDQRRKEIKEIAAGYDKLQKKVKEMGDSLKSPNGFVVSDVEAVEELVVVPTCKRLLDLD